MLTANARTGLVMGAVLTLLTGCTGPQMYQDPSGLGFNGLSAGQASAHSSRVVGQPYGAGYAEPRGCGMGYGPVSGCGGYGGGGGGGWFSKETLGTLGGAAAGGLAGAQIGRGSGQLAATAGGVLLGALLGREIGASLDRADETYAAMQTQRALSINQAIAWQGQNANGVIIPTRTVPKKKKSDATCREFRHLVKIGDNEREATGTACLQRDGSWKQVASR